VESRLHFCYAWNMPATCQHEPEQRNSEAAEHAALRVDAARNRTCLVEAAREVFARHGLEAPLEEIARRARVGIATLYRRFPTRDDLIAASFERTMAAYADAVDEALRAESAWSGFRGFVERVCAMQAADRGLRDVLTLSFPRARAFEAQRIRAYEGFAELVRLAQAEGALRPDFVPEDLILLFLANAGVMQGTGEAAPAAWKRFVALMIEACRADRAHPLSPPPTPAHLYRALCRHGRSRSGPDG
jgi:AcrR family transcriptional regulator